MNHKLKKAKNILKESILKGKVNFLNDTNIYINYLKFLDCPYSINNNYEHIIKYDVNILISFLIKNKLPIFNLETITEEINKVVPKLISKKILTDKATYYLKELMSKLNFSELYISTMEETTLSKKYGWMKDTFGKEKNNQKDLLIFIVAKRNKIKIIITSNYNDFLDCENVYKQKINPNDTEETLILKPSEMKIIIDELKKEKKL